MTRATVDLQVTQLSAGVNAGQIRAEDLAAQALARVAAYALIQPEVFIHRASESDVLQQARAVDARIAAGQHLPLAGVPFAVKDNIDVAAMPTTAGCPAYGHRAEHSATVVGKLLEAGAVCLGKTNLDQFATGLVGTRSPYGAPRCVYNREFVSGGSSSGSAVAVAAGLVAFALGTDTAGSGRVPAAFNGLIGLKPTKGRWSTLGVVPACRSLDCVSALTTTVGDAMLLDEVVAGFDAGDPFSRHGTAEPAFGAAFRFGVPRPEQLQFLGDETSSRLYQNALSRMVAAGGTPVEVDIAPLMKAAQLLYSGPWIAERTAAIEDFLRKCPGAIHPVVRAIIAAGAGTTAVQAFRGQYELQALARQAQLLWSAIEVLVLPTTPTVYRVSEVLAEPVALNSNLGLYTNFVNLLDMSAVAVPAGFRANQTGFGITLIGNAFMDGALLRLAQRYLDGGTPFVPPALDLSARTAGVQVAVVGAHLAGMPLHWQLSSRNARLVSATHTAAHYRLFAMAHSSPPKPALIHTGGAGGGSAIAVEVYELELAAFGSFVAEIPPPLAIGSVVLADGSVVKGFIAEPRATEGARDVTAFGGWRAYIASLS
ncbi:MAG TPA: allophanate hydrolase [Steroidobacteraceae bacterium]|jgi:allophanate hydrolase|nr:allophanate hydrolase [Steroidobacteraceae bacterium]